MDKYHILITGGAGFIGSNLAHSLVNKGHHVRVLDDFSAGTRKNLEGLESKVEILEGSITDLEICRKACSGIDRVCHQAAFGSVPRSLKFPSMYSFTNVHGMVNLAQAAKEAGIQRFVYASSSSVYGNSTQSPKKESILGQPLSPYAASKLSNEIFAHAFSEAYGMTFVGLRYFNVFGPRQNPEGDYAAVIPLFFKHLLKRSAPLIYGDGAQARDFTFVENVVQANDLALTSNSLKGSEVYNIGCGDTTSVNTLYHEISRLLNLQIPPIYQPPRTGDVKNSLADISKAKSNLGYDPKISLREGLEKTKPYYLKLFSD